MDMQEAFQVAGYCHGAQADIKGFLHVHKRLGRLPLETVVAPALHLAHNGLTVNDSQAYFLKLLKPIMTFSAVGQSLYNQNDNYMGAGALLANPELARFLNTLPVDQGIIFGMLLAILFRRKDPIEKVLKLPPRYDFTQDRLVAAVPHQPIVDPGMPRPDPG